MKTLCVDNGKEYLNCAIKQYLRSHGICLELTAPYSSAQNGNAECANLTIVNAAHAMLFAHDLPTFLWPKAVQYANYLRNCSPMRAPADKTPFEVFWGRKPHVGHLRDFGADCWVLRQDMQLHKLTCKSRACKFVGFSKESLVHRYYNPAIRQVQTSTNVISISPLPLRGSPRLSLCHLRGSGTLKTCHKHIRDLPTPPPHLPQPWQSHCLHRFPSAPAHTSSQVSTTAASTTPPRALHLDGSAWYPTTAAR